ncbi:tail terminator [Microbacterium phage Theresita]|nr:tail terminator [Microbacterium phage Theresita]
MDMQSIREAVEGLGLVAYTGYPSSNSRAPYVVVRPMIVDTENIAINGATIDWDHQYGLYCVGGSVEASFNLAKAVVQGLDGERMGDSTLSPSIGYVGAQVEGNYETQVTVQSTQGGI